METTRRPAPSAVDIDETAENHASPSCWRMEGLAGTVTTAGGVERYLTDRQTKILEERGINVELAVRLGWRAAGRGDSIEIPYYRAGKEVNCKTRTIEGEKRFHQVAGGDKCLYNLDIMRDLGDSPLVITEGEMDCLVALDSGYMAVSVPDGAPQQVIGDKETVKYDYLRDVPANVKKIILAVDGDNAGANLLHDLGIRLGKHRCQWVKYPPGCKDLNDVFKAWGHKGVQECLTGAQYLHIEGLYRMSELPPVPEAPALHVGVSTLDPHLKLRRGDFSVWTGIPSHGKTTLVNYLTFNMAIHHGWSSCYASFEQSPQTEHRRALRTLHGGKPAHLQSMEQRTAADEFIDKYFSFIAPDDDSDEWNDMTWLQDLMAAAVTRYNADMVVIDPWNELDHVYDQREVTMTQYVGRAIKEFKRFARKYRVHGAEIAHPAKLVKNKNGEYPVPSAYDISDSAHWYNKPDQIVVVHRTEKKHTLVKVAKSRYHDVLGKPGEVELDFDDYTYRFNSLELGAL